MLFPRRGRNPVTQISASHQKIARGNFDPNQEPETKLPLASRKKFRRN